MHRAAVSLVFLLGSIAATAQSPNQNQSQGTVQKTTTAPDGTTKWTTRSMSQAELQQAVAKASSMINTCPVSLQATHAPGGDMMKVNGVPIEGIAQKLHLTVTNPDSRRVVAANVTVRGFADKARLMQVMPGQHSFDAARTLDVRFPVDPGKETSADLRVPGLTAISAIDLNSVTYADGSVWKLASGGSCRSWIDGFMLVGSH